MTSHPVAQIIPPIIVNQIIQSRGKCLQSKPVQHIELHLAGKKHILNLATKGQTTGWGSPFLARQSAVQHFLCATIHMKNLHLPSAQVFQTLS